MKEKISTKIVLITLFSLISLLPFVFLKEIEAQTEIQEGQEDDQYILPYQKPTCIDGIKDKQIKKNINNFMNEVNKTPTWPGDVQISYLKALKLYGKIVLVKKAQSDRVCLLEVLIGSAKVDPENALQELMADWYNGDHKAGELEAFYSDFKSISTFSSSEQFLKDWINLLKEYSQTEN